VGHSNYLYDDLTAYENLLFRGRMHGLNDLRERIYRAATRLGLEERLHPRVRTLSHGLQKRVVLAAAILHDPAILLLDEPEAGLDQEALGMLGQLLQEWKGGQRAVLMTTHNLEQGLALGDRVAILSRGKIAYQEERSALDVAGFRGTYQRYLEASL
jgi:ABC-type multidrug transport system ATPase subunit